MSHNSTQNLSIFYQKCIKILLKISQVSLKISQSFNSIFQNFIQNIQKLYTKFPKIVLKISLKLPKFYSAYFPKNSLWTYLKFFITSQEICWNFFQNFRKFHLRFSSILLKISRNFNWNFLDVYSYFSKFFLDFPTMSFKIF